MTEQQFLEVVRAARSLGYGRMMQIVSREWYQHDPIGAISDSKGQKCYGSLTPAQRESQARAIAADPLFKKEREERP